MKKINKTKPRRSTRKLKWGSKSYGNAISKVERKIRGQLIKFLTMYEHEGISDPQAELALLKLVSYLATCRRSQIFHTKINKK